jgi:predicted translin family RNA/ssDNA-binding protein
MENKENAEKVVKIVRDYKNESNKNIKFAMDFIKSDFDNTKETIIQLTKHLDKLENTYNVLLSEYKKRNETK